MQRVVIVDYGSGNLRSVYNAFRYLGEDVKVCEDAGEMENFKKIVLPGVGSSKDAMDGLKERGLIEPLLNLDKRTGNSIGLSKINQIVGFVSGCIQCLDVQKLFAQAWV